MQWLGQASLASPTAGRPFITARADAVVQKIFFFFSGLRNHL
jgi:hypothetical protein